MYDKILTVSIAAYNVEKYIDQTLSVFEKSDVKEKMEVLIVDDGGSDSTREIAQRYTDKYPSVFKFIHKKNGGWGSTLNASIPIAKGKYFKQLDGDDYFDQDDLADFTNLLERIDSDVVISKVRTFDDISGDILDITKYADNTVLGKEITIAEAGKQVRLTMHTCTFRTSILRDNEIRLVEKCFYVDQEYFIKSIAYAETAYIVDKIVYCYRLGREGQSMSLEGQLKHYKDNFKVIDSLMSFDNQLPNTLKTKLMVHEYIYKYLIGIYNRLIVLNKREDLVWFDKKVRKEYENYNQELPKRVNVYSTIHFVFVKQIDAFLSKVKK